MTALPRLLLVECPALTAPVPDAGHAGAGAEEDGRRLRLFARLVDALAEVCPWIDAVRPGVCTLPIRGPTRYFGSEEAVLERVAETVAAVTAPGDASPAFRLGVADGLFAATLASRAGVVVGAGETEAFLAPWPVDALGDPDLADVLVRLGLTTLGRFAAVPAHDVLARFGAAGAHCHRVARGIEGELPGWRVPGTGRRLVAALGRELALAEHQPGFWGGASAADERAAEVLTDLQRRLGTEAVAVPVLDGGRGPADRCRLAPWRPAAAVEGDHAAHGSRAGRVVEPPWPGRLPPPAPARVPPDRGVDRPADQGMAGADRAAGAEMVDRDGAPVTVTARGLLTGRPARLSVGGGPWAPVAGWSAPWPVEERWWSRGRRRAARLQVLAAEPARPDRAAGHDGAAGAEGAGRAYLLVVERGRWRVEAAYD